MISSQCNAKRWFHRTFNGKMISYLHIFLRTISSLEVVKDLYAPKFCGWGVGAYMTEVFYLLCSMWQRKSHRKPKTTESAELIFPWVQTTIYTCLQTLEESEWIMDVLFGQVSIILMVYPFTRSTEEVKGFSILSFIQFNKVQCRIFSILLNK